MEPYDPWEPIRRLAESGPPRTDASASTQTVREVEAPEAPRRNANFRGIALVAGAVVFFATVVVLWFVMPDNRSRALLLFGIALVMQLAGAALVVLDVRQSIRNTRQLKVDLASAEATAQEHHRALAEGPDVVRRFRAVLGHQQTDQLLRQLGPTSLQQREALVRHLNAQNETSDVRRWSGVVILLGGVVVGFIGNVVALYA